MILEFSVKRMITLTTILALSPFGLPRAESFTNPKAFQLRVNLPYSFPVDPLYVRTMADYDISLALWQTWFTYDKGRRADHGIIERWSFDSTKGLYKFEIAAAKWSNGTKLTSDHLIQNLRRAALTNTPYSQALKAIVDIQSLKRIDDRSFLFRTNDGKPTTALFNQLGSIFFSIVHPADLGQDHKLRQNKLFLGPFAIKEGKPGGEFRLIRNPAYNMKNDRAPKEVLLRHPDPEFSIAKFLARKTWANYYQANSILSLKDAKGVVDSHFPIWTRGFDRVALVRPLGEGSALKSRRAVALWLANLIGNHGPVEHPLQVALARSLQPLGYPLYDEIRSPAPKAGKPQSPIRILSLATPQLEFIRPWLEGIAKTDNVDLVWDIRDPAQFLSMDWDSTESDLALFSFGVADPEPTTWLSLVFNSKFISYDESDRRKFAAAMKLDDPAAQIREYRGLLSEIALKGGYVPLLHGATMAIGQPGLNFDLVDPLDETVDYAKIRMAD